MDDVLNIPAKRRVIRESIVTNEKKLAKLQGEISEIEALAENAKSVSELRSLTRKVAHLWGELKGLQAQQMELMLQLEHVEGIEEWLADPLN